MLPLLLGLAGAAFKAFQGARQNKLANKIKPQQVTKEISPYAQANLGLAQNLYNGRMPGAVTAEQNILNNQSNIIGNVNRNATNSSQALALATGVQGQTNQSLNQLGVHEGQFKVNAAGQLMNANQGMTGELDKVHNDAVRRYQEDSAAKAALRQSGMGNIYGAFGDAAGAALGYQQNGGTFFGGRNNSNMIHANNMPGPVDMTAAPNTGAIPLPGQGSMRPPTFNFGTGKWEYHG